VGIRIYMVAGARSMGRCEEPSHTTTDTEYSGGQKNNVKIIARIIVKILVIVSNIIFSNVYHGQC
jgi:hypothetical protein